MKVVDGETGFSRGAGQKADGNVSQEWAGRTETGNTLSRLPQREEWAGDWEGNLGRREFSRMGEIVVNLSATEAVQ